MKESASLLQNIKVIMGTQSVTKNSKLKSESNLFYVIIKPWIPFYKRIFFRAMSKDFLLPHNFRETY